MIIDADKTSSETIIKNLNEKSIAVTGFNNKFPIIITEVLWKNLIDMFLI